MTIPRTPGQRAGLSRQAVLTAARQLVADEGVDALTMRSLADRLGVHPNALYSHVAGKAELEEAVLDGLLADVRVPAGGGDWRTAVHALMRSTYDVLLAHPDVVPLYLGRGSRGENAQRLGAVMLELLGRGGVTGPSAVEAQSVLIVFTIGFAAFAARPGFEHQQPDARRARLDGNFDRGLAWLIDGIAGG
jgi:TetR/AcrR family transcriptional regulator, tetracycline repressor protein